MFIVNFSHNMRNALICPFNAIQSQLLQDKLKGHIRLTICVSYKLLSYGVPFMRKFCDGTDTYLTVKGHLR